MMAKLDLIDRNMQRLGSPLSKMREEYLDIPETCRFLGISRRTLYNHMDAGEIPYTLYNRKRRFNVEDLNQFLVRHKTT